MSLNALVAVLFFACDAVELNKLLGVLGAQFVWAGRVSAFNHFRK